VFSIYLPAMPRSALPAKVPIDMPPPRRVEPPPGLRVLLVEDDAAVRMILSRGLLAQGLAVTVAADAAAALEILHAGAVFDVLVSDVMMPGIDGVELAAQARKLRPNLPIILMSGFAEAPRHRAADAQGVGFLAKPFVLADLVAAITEQSDLNY
jgi:two-component system cell cycle sensor histidine kinase/response regulator CckA